MGLLPPAVKMLVGARNYLQKTAIQKKPWKILSLSWQDVILTNTQIIALLGGEFVSLPNHPDQDVILKWHKAFQEGNRVLDWISLLARLGFDPTVTDIGVFRGGEEIMDLNYPLPEKYEGQFDMVLDNCSQHCANIGQSMMNVAKALCVGGVAMHVTPLQMINQGFYSISPCLYHDFYSQNGFKVLEHSGYTGGKLGADITPLAIDPIKRMRLDKHDAMQMFIATKVVPQELKWPTQTKFVNIPDSTMRDGSQ